MKKKKPAKKPRVIPARSVIPATRSGRSVGQAGIPQVSLGKKKSAKPAQKKQRHLVAKPPLSTVDATVVGKLPVGWTTKKVASLATLAATHAGFRGKGVVSVKVVADAEMRKLNKMYRDKDKTTDVLSFGYTALNASHASEHRSALAKNVIPAEAGIHNPVTELGDIVISLPQVRRQATEIGRDAGAEFALMVVHGVLHVLGHDHVTLAQETRMFSLQHEILLQSGWF